jgi:hypothetical protein
MIKKEKYGRDTCTSIDDELDEEINKYITGSPVFANEPIPRNLFNDCIIAAAHHFSKWHENKMKEVLQTEYEKGRFDMREEMVKNAVDGKVVYQIGSAEIAPTDIRYKVVSDKVYIPNAKLGDKVKILIIKP